MTWTLLEHRTTFGNNVPTGNNMTGVVEPHTTRNRNVRAVFEIKGGDGATVHIRLLGRATPDAPFYLIQEVIGNWETIISPQVKCNTDGTYALETVAFPEMKARVQAYNAGSSNIASASNGLGLSVNPVAGDTLTISDGYGNTIVFVFYTGDASITSGLGIPVLIGSDVSETCTAIKSALSLYNSLPHPDYKPFHITGYNGTFPFQITFLHNIPGPRGNSATITSSNTVGSGGTAFNIGSFLGGSGTDTYGSCWLDDGK